MTILRGIFFLNADLMTYVSPPMAVPEEPLTLSTQTNGLPQSVTAPLLVKLKNWKD